MNKINCNVCCEDVNHSKQVTCVKCNHTCCVQCMKKFILSTIEEPHCMNCKLQWSYEFLFSVLPKTFINTTYKIHKTNSLISNEKQFLQATIPLIIRQKKIEEKKNEIQALKTIKKDLQKQIRDANVCIYLILNFITFGTNDTLTSRTLEISIQKSMTLFFATLTNSIVMFDIIECTIFDLVQFALFS